MDFPTVFSKNHVFAEIRFELKKKQKQRRVPYTVTVFAQFVHAAPHVWRHVVRPSVRRRRRVSRGTAQASCAHRPWCVDVSYNHRRQRHRATADAKTPPARAMPHIVAETTTPPPDRP